MLGAVAHIGITVRDMNESLRFYRDLLGLKVLGDLMVEGDEADTLTREHGVKLRVAYLRSEKDLKGPPLELLPSVSVFSGAPRCRPERSTMTSWRWLGVVGL